MHTAHRQASLISRTVAALWWSMALTFIGALLMAGALAGYCCMSSLIASDWSSAGGFAIGSIVAIGFACALARFRVDLVGE